MMAPRLLTLAQVEDLIGFRKTWIYQRMAEGSFPKPADVEGAKRWRSTEVDAWLREHGA